MRRRIRDSLRLAPALTTLTGALLVVSAPPAARGQLAQYTPPGTTEDRPDDEKEQLELQLAEAFWKAGAFGLDPWIGITNGAVVVNSFGTPDSVEQQRDTTLTLGAGISGIVPAGSKTYLTFEAIPQYVLWLEQDERNNYNQWFGARIHGFYNHLFLEAGANRRDAVRIRGSETDVETNTRYDVADLFAELRLGEAIHLFGGATLARIRTLEDEADPLLPDYSAEDRDETIGRLGVRYKPRATSYIGIGVELSDADFVDEARDRSNKGTSPLVQFRHEAPEFYLTGEVVFRDLEPEGETSAFVPYDGITGKIQLSYEPGWRMTYSPYVRRDVFYSINQEYSYYETSRYGLAVQALLSERWTGRIYAEGGVDDYVELDPAIPAREDDFTSIGIDFGVRISELLALRIGYSVDQWDSNLEGFDRDNGRLRLLFNTGLRLGRR